MMHISHNNEHNSKPNVNQDFNYHFKNIDDFQIQKICFPNNTSKYQENLQI